MKDGLAVVQGGTQIVIAEANEDSAWLRVATTSDIAQRKSLRPLAGVPNDGIVSMGPFAYYAVGCSIRHVDLTTGLVETNGGGGAQAAAAAVNG